MLVMEKLEGRSLRALLDATQMLAPPRAVFIALQVLSALAAAHRANIVHRDVKPGNIFILKTLAVPDFVKVLDFGIAKVLDADVGAPQLTNLGQVLGTTAYMAPEQAMGRRVDARADLFAVGAVLFQAISGQRPRDLRGGGIAAAIDTPCRKLHDVASFVDPRLAAAVDKALSLDPAGRYESAEAMARALAPFASQQQLDVGHDVGTTRHVSAAVTVVDAGQTAQTHLSAAPSRSPPAPPTPTMAMTAPLQHGTPVLARPSYRPPPRGSGYPGPPAVVRSRSVGWLLLIPVVVVVLAVAGVAAIVKMGLDLAERDRVFMTKARPSKCVAPSTCSGRTSTNTGDYTICAPARPGQPRVGDVVFADKGRGAYPYTFVRVEGSRYRLADPAGQSVLVESGMLVGTYCAAP
jgi:hypothetical protein